MIRHTAPYDKKTLMKSFFGFLALVFMCKFTGGNAMALLIPATFVLGLMNRSLMILKLLLFTTIVMILGDFFIPKFTVFAVSQKIILLSIALLTGLTFISRAGNRNISPLAALFPYLVYMAVISQFGWAPVISNLKLFLFTAVFISFYGCALKVVSDTRISERDVRHVLLVPAIFIIAGSLLVSRFPEISYMNAADVLFRDAFLSLYQGVTNHSQTLGPTVAILCTMLYADLVFSVQKADKLYIALLLICLVLIYKTSSRTAMGSCLAGIAFVTFFAIRSRGMIKKKWQMAVLNFSFGAVFLAFFAVLALPSLREKASMFVLKTINQDTTFSTEVLLASRRFVLDHTLENWRQSPIIGNGFQVSETMQHLDIGGIKDILTAPVEKSTWTYAVLEEGGVVGMVLFSLFILISLGLMIKRRSYIGASTLFVFLVINLGEFTMFSMSNIGGVYWCLVFIALMLDSKRNTRVRRRLYHGPLPQGAPPPPDTDEDGFEIIGMPPQYPTFHGPWVLQHSRTASDVGSTYIALA